MKTKEFIEKVEELGFEVNSNGSIISVKNSKEDYMTVADIGKENEFEVNTFNYLFYYVKDNTKKDLFDLMVKYASTPIEEREEEKEYYLKHKWLNLKHENVKYLVCTLSSDEYKLGTGFNGVGFKTQFTQKEIEEIKEKFDTDLGDFEIIEVEE